MQQRALVIVVLLGALGGLQPASAHNIDIEPQAADAAPKHSEAIAFSEQPYDLLDHTLGYTGGVLTSRAIFGWLDKGEVDVYTFTSSPVDFQQAQDLFGIPFPAVAVVAAPLASACEQSKHDYPAIALAGPCSLVPPYLGDVEVPVDLPPGYCLTEVTINTESKDRVVFTESHTGTAWYLPDGCFLQGAFPNCFDSDTLTAFLPPVPGVPYFMYVWNPDGKAFNYTLNSGIDENPAYVHEDPGLEDVIADNDWVFGECTLPH